MMADESDMTMAKVRLDEGSLLAEHVEKINCLRMDTRKTEAV